MRKIRREDNVLVIKGKDRGRIGQVRKVLTAAKKTDKYFRPEAPALIVTGINVVKRHMRSRGPQQPGGIIEREAPIAISNVALICTACDKPARVGFTFQSDGKKVRYCKRCNANLD